MVLMPGPDQRHTHLPMTILRGYADDLKLQEWLNDYIFPREAHLDDRAGPRRRRSWRSRSVCASA